MKGTLTTIAFLVAMPLQAANAVAGQYSQELDKCLVSSTTDKDKADLVRWLFVSMSGVQDLRDVFSVSPDQRERLTRTAAQVFERLVTMDCRLQFLTAVREGDDPGTAVTALSQAVMSRVLNDPALANNARELGRLIHWPQLPPVAESTKP